MEKVLSIKKESSGHVRYNAIDQQEVTQAGKTIEQHTAATRSSQGRGSGALNGGNGALWNDAAGMRDAIHC